MLFPDKRDFTGGRENKSAPPFVYNNFLPIHEKRTEIIDSVRSNQVTIVAGETGSGKTTQLPLICMEAGRGETGRIGCTQPRRLATVSLAHFLASSMGSNLGADVGYKIRFHDRLADSTLIKFMTDGILLSEIAGDRLLEQYDTIFIDEAHERSVNIDFLLGYFRTLLPQRPNFRLIISSATMDTKLFSRFFHHAPIITVSGRLYPVEIQYKPVVELWKGESVDSYVHGAVTAVKNVVDLGLDGDILLFLPTIQDIFDAVGRLRHLIGGKKYHIYPLHSRMAINEQHAIFENHKVAKIIVATNIAETSITVPGIRFVIDSGLVRTLRYDPVAAISRMPIERTSKASADQRAGRCGRVRDGICIRLFSEQDYLSRPAFTTPEIKRSNLAGVILRMAQLQLGKPEKFPFPQRPLPRALMAGFRQLKELGAFTKSGILTKRGKQMARLPLDPPIARMLLYARAHGTIDEIAVIASALSIDDPFLHSSDSSGAVYASRRRFRHPESDFMTYQNVWKAIQKVQGKKKRYSALRSFCSENGLSFLRVRQWIDAHEQIIRICKKMGPLPRSPLPSSYESIHKSLLTGLAGTIAKREDRIHYTGIHTNDIAIFPDSTLFSKPQTWVLFHSIMETNRTYGRVAAAIHPRWIETLFPSRCSYFYDHIGFDPETGTVRAKEHVRYQGMTLIDNRDVNLATKDRSYAHEVFIREALIEELIGFRYRFIEHNRWIINTIETAQQKLRSRSYYLGDWALESFYQEQLPDCTSVDDLHKILRERKGDVFLFISKEQLLVSPLSDSIADYPDDIVIGDCTIPVSYAYAPDKETDGATITIPQLLYETVPIYYWEWLLPCMRNQRIALIFKNIHLEDNDETLDVSTEIVKAQQTLSAATGPFITVVRHYLHTTYGIEITAEDLRPELFPSHLWLRINITDEKGVIRATFRPPVTQSSLPHDEPGKRHSVWSTYSAPYELDNITDWDFGSIPPYVHIASSGQLVPLVGKPVLCREGNSVRLRVFLSPYTASEAHTEGVKFLLEQYIAHELAWLLNDVSVPQHLLFRYQSIAEKQTVEMTVERIFHQKLLSLPSELPYDRKSFIQLVDGASALCIVDTWKQMLQLMERCISEYEHSFSFLQKMGKKHEGTFYAPLTHELFESLDAYLQLLFSPSAPVRLIGSLPRYLKSFSYRIEMAYLNPKKYREIMGDIRKYRECISDLQTLLSAKDYQVQKKLAQMREIVEEYTIMRFSPQMAKLVPKVKLEDLNNFTLEIKNLMEKQSFFRIP